MKKIENLKHLPAGVHPAFALPLTIRISFVWLVALFGASVLATSGVAQVSSFGVQKSGFYLQKQNNTLPAKANSYSLYAYVSTSGADQADSFTVSAVGTLTLDSSDGQNFGGSNFYKTRKDLDAAFPTKHQYQFTAVGGSLNGESDKLPIKKDAYAPVLYLLGTGLTDAEELNPNSDFTINLGTSGHGAAATQVSFAIYGTEGLIYVQDSPAGTTSFTIPQATIESLTPGVYYSAQIANFNTSDVKSKGSFGTAPDVDGWVSTTTFRIRVKK